MIVRLLPQSRADDNVLAESVGTLTRYLPVGYLFNGRMMDGD